MIDTCQLRINQKSESELVHTGFLSARLLLEVKKSSLAVEVRAVRDSPRKPNSMLSKSRRLTSNDVTRVLKQGRSKRALFLSMKFLELQTPLRTSAVVSKSVARRAVERNRLRRAVYQALTPLSGHGYAVVFVQKIPPEGMSLAFKEDIAQLFKNMQ